MLQRKDFQETPRLAWAQEVPSSNLGAPTTYFFSANATFLLILIRVFNYKPASL